MSSFPHVVAVKQDFPAQTVQKYLAAATAKPGTISYGTPPAAGMGQMAGEELQRRAEIKLIHVPYRGGTDAAREIGAASVDSVITTPIGLARPSLPDASTLNESGLPGFDLNDWNGMFAATGTPAAIVDRMQAVIAEAVKDTKVRERLDPTGADLVANSPAEFKTWLTGQRELLGKLIVAAGIKLQ